METDNQIAPDVLKAMQIPRFNEKIRTNNVKTIGTIMHGEGIAERK